MKKRLLERHDIIEIKKGMIIYANIPEKFVYNNAFFSDKIVEEQIRVGRIYVISSEQSEKLEQINLEIERSIKNTLQLHKLNPEIYIDDIHKFVKSLNLKGEENIFDTSIYEGKYKVYFTLSKDISYFVYCEKLDDSGIEIKFDQNYYKNSNFTLLNNFEEKSN